MKAIIIGGGSIGQRHSKNLNDLGVLTRIVDIDEIDNIDNILNEGFDMGLVCSPNIKHVEHSLKLAEYNIPIFCEKPFYCNKEGVEELLDTVLTKNLINMVGCNLRFTEEVKSIPTNCSYVNSYFGYNLKKWRPETNHLSSYSSNSSLGGGVLLDAIHELDYLYHIFGEIESISFTKDKIANITIDTEDLVTGRMCFKNGTIADFTLNYLSESYLRYFDFLEKDTLKRVAFDIKDKMYVDEIRYFITKIKTGEKCMNSFEESHSLLKYIV